jgi:hypothetical protein
MEKAFSGYTPKDFIRIWILPLQIVFSGTRDGSKRGSCPIDLATIKTVHLIFFIIFVDVDVDARGRGGGTYSMTPHSFGRDNET